MTISKAIVFIVLIIFVVLSLGISSGRLGNKQKRIQPSMSEKRFGDESWLGLL